MKIANLQLAITIAVVLPHAHAFSLLTPGKAFRAALDPKNLAPKKGAAAPAFVDKEPANVVMSAATEGSTPDTQAPKGPAGLNQWDPSAQQINSSKWIEPAVVSKLSSFSTSCMNILAVLTSSDIAVCFTLRLLLVCTVCSTCSALTACDLLSAACSM
jgi:hypothetical protein